MADFVRHQVQVVDVRIVRKITAYVNVPTHHVLIFIQQFGHGRWRCGPWYPEPLLRTNTIMDTTSNPYIVGDEPTQEVEDEVSEHSFLFIYILAIASAGRIFCEHLLGQRCMYVEIGEDAMRCNRLTVNDRQTRIAVIINALPCILLCSYNHVDRPRPPSYRSSKSGGTSPASACWPAPALSRSGTCCRR